MRIRQACFSVVALIALAACGTNGPGAEPAPTSMPEAEVLALGKQIAQCFRDQGIVELPDPIVDEQGRLQFPDNVEAEIEGRYPASALEQAQQRCQSLFDQLPESAIRGESTTDDDMPGPEDFEALTAWAECLRANGIPEFPDPKPDGTFPLVGTPLEGQMKSPRLAAATDKCDQHWGGRITIS